jgi:hypothetical protein
LAVVRPTGCLPLLLLLLLLLLLPPPPPPPLWPCTCSGNQQLRDKGQCLGQPSLVQLFRTVPASSESNILGAPNPLKSGAPKCSPTP